MAGQEPPAVRELRALVQYQLAVRPCGIFGYDAQKTLNML